MTITEWQEVVLCISGVTMWGGFVVRALPGLTHGGSRRWSLQC